MSVSDMNVSWSTQSRKSSNTARSAFITNTTQSGDYHRLQRPNCVSAKHSGMRFQGWREPKPLRSRCNSAVTSTDLERSSERLKSARRSSKETSNEAKALVNRLSQPTTSSKWKTSTARAREVGTDMNYYSWSKMNVYTDYQKVLYGANGTVKKTNQVKER